MKSSPQQQYPEAVSLETPKKRILPTVVSANDEREKDDFVRTPKSKRSGKQLEDDFSQTPKGKRSHKHDDELVQTPKNKRRSVKKSQRRRTSSESDEDKIDMKTEENIQQAALKNNLTEDAVKKILKKVVGNDHVLAIVKLKEDEMEKNCQKNSTDEEDESDIEHTPKITRSKARTLNKKILPITSPMEPSEASILIQEELGSDDEDEEYEPGNEDIHSDEDPNSSISDMDSQPRTPRTPHTADEDTPTKYSNDGLFKIPRTRTESSTSQNEQDYIIAKRTRSKVSLATTSIETIESTFQPPDISPDMYDGGNEMDTDWLEFLNVLSKPINHTVEEDDEADPEYVAADRIPIDKEELREVNISKKELNDLVDELFSNLSDVDFDEINKYDIIPELYRTKQKPTKTDMSNEVNKTVEQDEGNTTFEPRQISTPIQSKQQKNLHTTAETTIQENSSMLMLSSSMLTNTSIVANSNNQTPVVVPINVVNPLYGAAIVNGVIQIPQYQQVLIQIPTIDILKMQSQMQTNQNHSNLNISNLETAKVNQTSHQQTVETLRSEHPLDDFIKRPTTASVYRRTRYQHQLFQHLKNEAPVEVIFDEGLKGFTQPQWDIFNQQLRIHVQFVTQNFLQVYGNPGNNLWQHAVTFKSFLTDFNEQTQLRIDNLQPALDLVKKWEEDLSTATVENTDYLDFLLNQSNNSQNATQRKSSYIPKFHERMMDAIVDSPVFMYPHLLPKIPFRMDSTKKTTLSAFEPIEDYLIAFYLETFFNELKEEKIRNKCQLQVNIPLDRVCHKIGLRMCPFRVSDSKKSVYKYVLRRKSKNEPFNPIQYYFLHKKAPLFRHDLFNVNINNQLTPKDFPLTDLPYAWAEYVKKRKAIEFENHNQQTSPGISKPIQKVLPRVRSTTANVEDSSLNLIEGVTPITSPSSTTSPAKPIYIIKPISSDDISAAVPIQYEIIKVNSTGQLVDQTEASTGGDIVERKPKLRSSSRRKSSKKKKQSDANIRGCTSKRRTKKKSNHKYKSYQSNSRINTFFSSFNPNKSREQNISENVVKSLKSKSLLKREQWLGFCISHKIVKKYLRIRVRRRSVVNHLLSQKLCRIVRNYKREFNEFHQKATQTKHLLDLHNVYVSLIILNLKMSAAIKRASKEGGEDLNRRLTFDDVPVEEPENNATASVISKKIPKPQRSDNTRLMLLSETTEDINEKDIVYAQNFMDKVEEIYSAENNPGKLKEFQDLLQKFSQSTDRVPDLYYKMEELFLPDHPELVDLFLTFLLPGQAAQVGKFMEHFMLTNMNTFIYKLNVFFNKQPAQIRKIMTCLRDLANEDDLKLEQIKTKILPLLKGHPLLIEWFKQCLPNDTPFECPEEDYESLSFHKVENPHDENDVYEHIPQTDILPDPVENPCHIRYLNGRVYYGNRILLPAKLSFLVVNAKDQNAMNELARNENGNLRTEADYRCVHSIKQYGDNKMKECQKSQLETSDILMSDDIDSERVVYEQNCNDPTDETEIQQSETSIQLEEKHIIDSAEHVYQTCDDLSLKAHGIRLNPNFHQSTVIKSEDLLCLLDPINDSAAILVEESLRNSPKKHVTKAHRKSPNYKKSTKRSPTNNRKGFSAGGLSTDESQAVQTAKRLKRLIETDEVDEPVHPLKKSKLTKYSKTVDDSGHRKSKLSQSEEIQSTGIDNKEETIDSISTPEVSMPLQKTESSVTSNVTNIWSRDEDKLVLEQIKMGFTNEDDLVKTLCKEKLLNRSYSEIYERFRFLMDVIANL